MPMIAVYGLPGCPMCDRIKQRLSAINEPFEYVTDEQLMASKGITHVPVADAEGQLLSGKELLDYVKKLEESNGRDS